MTICIIFLPNCTEFVQRNWPRIEECMDVFDELRIFRQICKCECGCHCWIDGRKTRTFFPFSAAFLLLFGTPGFWGTCSCWWTDTRNDEKLRPGNAEMKMRRKHKAISADLGENLLICHTKRYFHLICICCLHPKSWKKKNKSTSMTAIPHNLTPAVPTATINYTAIGIINSVPIHRFHLHFSSTSVWVGAADIWNSTRRQGNQLQSKCNKSLAHANPSERHALIGIQCAFLTQFYDEEDTSFIALKCDLVHLILYCTK